jgi:hypothetical protein
MIKVCKEQSCIFNKDKKCNKKSVCLDEEGICISKEQE